MATRQLRRVIHQLHTAAFSTEEAGLTDGQLLERYVRSREEEAFAALVRQHGPMVWGVCRRVLASHHDAEDAFQATFLVLVRKAASIVPREMVANWLYGVAHCTALKARSTTARRRTREKQVTAMPESVLPPHALWDDLRPVLDRELSRLPEKYRAVLVLCDLEGKTRKEAARQFHLPEGTVATRLATARTMLAKRLARYAPALSGAALAAALVQDTASAGVPRSVAFSTIKAATLFAAGQAAAGGLLSGKAVALAEGVLQTMLLTKLKIATAVLTFLVLGAAAATLTQQTLAGKAEPPAAQPAAETPPDKLSAPPKLRADPAAEEKKVAEPLPQTVGGTARAVDAAKRTLTVATNDGAFTFRVASGAQITIDGKPGELAGLPTGCNVRLSRFVEPKTVRDVQAEGRWIWGARVEAVDPEKNVLRVLLGHGEGEKTFTITPTTVLRIDRKPGQLTGVPKGATVSVGLCVDQQTVHSLDAAGAWLGGGRVSAVDAGRNTITFGERSHSQLAGKTFPVAEKAEVRIDGKPGKLAGIPAGASVNVSLAVDQQTALGLDAQGEHLGECGGSLVKEVSTQNNSITFDDKASPDVAGKTFTLAKDASILIDDKPGPLHDIPVGSYVNVTLSVDQKLAQQVRAGGGRLGGTVKAVDAPKGNVTVDDRTYSVARDAVIVIDGKPATLAALPIGATVSANLRIDRRTVGFIQTVSAHP
jgi:RNA polymerase sigma factor (sigma-70 family)